MTDIHEKHKNDFSKRIRQLLDYLKITPATFCRKCGMSNGSIIKGWISGEYEPAAESLRKIISRYPELNKNWLYFGVGSMWTDRQYFQKRFDELGNDKKTAKEKIEALLEIYECSYSELGKQIGLSKSLIYSMKKGITKNISTKHALKASKTSKFIPVEWFVVE